VDNRVDLSWAKVAALEVGAEGPVLPILLLGEFPYPGKVGFKHEFSPDQRGPTDGKRDDGDADSHLELQMRHYTL
jgi:hypothetical protein